MNVVGDTVAYTAPLDSELDDEERILYTRNDYYVLNNINDLGLNRDDFNDKSLIDSHDYLEEDHRMIALDLTIENKSGRLEDFTYFKLDFEREATGFE